MIGLDFYADQDIACHINQRYEFSCPVANKYVLVLNNRIANTWNTAEIPLGFPFFRNEQTSIIVTSLETAYYIKVRAADTTFTYEFSYRNEHKPHQVTRIQCYYIAMPVHHHHQLFHLHVLYALIGYRISSYSIATAIYVYATAPYSGDMAIDIILGVPYHKDIPVALKVKVFFDEDPQIFFVE